MISGHVMMSGHVTRHSRSHARNGHETCSRCSTPQIVGLKFDLKSKTRSRKLGTDVYGELRFRVLDFEVQSRDQQVRGQSRGTKASQCRSHVGVVVAYALGY